MLYDAYGRKVVMPELKQEQSAPSLRSVRMPYSAYPSTAITPQRLTSILRNADQGSPWEQCELFEEMEEKDAHLLSIMATRRRSVARLPLRISAPDGATAAELRATDLVKDQLSSIPHMPDIITNMMDAVGKGYSVSEIVWQISNQQAWVQDIKWREPKWFRFDQESMSEVRMLDAGSVDGTPLTPFKYIVHKHHAKSGIPVRGGVLRPCAWLWLFKHYSIKDWLVFNEVFGQPLRVGKYSNAASEDEKNILLQAVANMGTDAAAVIPEGMMIQFVESSAKSGSADLYERLARYADEQMSKAVLGQTSSADAMAGGLGNGQADLHGDVRHDLLESDVGQLNATLQRDLAKPMVDLNIGVQQRYPKVELLIEEPEDLEQIAKNSKTLHDMGLAISTSWLYAKFGIPEPAKGEAVLTTATAANSASVAATSPVDMPDQMAQRLAADAADASTAMVEQVRTLLADCDSLETFANRLPELLGDIDITAMRQVMAEAMTAADLGGQYQVQHEQS